MQVSDIIKTSSTKKIGNKKSGSTSFAKEVSDISETSETSSITPLFNLPFVPTYQNVVVDDVIKESKHVILDLISNTVDLDQLKELEILVHQCDHMDLDDIKLRIAIERIKIEHRQD